MTVDHKNAKHSCNIFRRRIQSSFPELHVYFLLHKENTRYATYLKEKTQILGLQAGHNLCNFLDDPNNKHILNANKSEFIALAQKRKNGFLGFAKQKHFVALCTLNYDRFSNNEHLLSHIFHLGWHAINTYKQYKDKPRIAQDNVILQPITKADQAQKNLMADIFACSLQKLDGDNSAPHRLIRQRATESVNKNLGFFAEQYPFPVCLETLEFTFKNDWAKYQKQKAPLLAALQITEDVGKAFDRTSIEKWLAFALPAQEMAWMDYKPEKTLGAAIYTGENTYAQSIADMIAEKLSLKPEIIANLHDYNPFANNDVNIRLHKKLCHDKYAKIIQHIKQCSDYTVFLDYAQSENNKLSEGVFIGWCAHGLTRAASVMLNYNNTQTGYQQAMEKAQQAFNEEIDSLAWDTLQLFGHTIFDHKRKAKNLSVETLKEIAQKEDEFGSIHYALTYTNPVLEPVLTDPQINEENQHKETEHQTPRSTQDLAST